MGALSFIRDSIWPADVVLADGAPAEAKAYSLPVPGTEAYAAFLAGVGGSQSKAGANVSLRDALGVSTVFACIRVIAEGLAQVPCKIYQRTDGGGRIEAREHPLWRLLYRRPNLAQTSFEFREQVAMHLALAGNAFVVITRDTQGRPLELLPYEPGFVRFERQPDLSVRYWVRTEKTREIEIPASMMWHIRGPSWEGWRGADLLALARDSIGLALATESFGSEMFANGTRLSGHLEVEGNPSPEVVDAIRKQWTAVHQGEGNRLKTALLAGGVKFQPHDIKADEAQYIETRKFLVPEICRFFRVMPIMVGHQDGTAAYASIEQMFLAHRTLTMGPWFERFEQSAELALLSERERDEYEIELVQHSLAGTTAKERAETLAIMRQNGAATGNDMREALDMPRGTEAILNEYTPAANLFGPRDATGGA
ncbi:phage portal protein [Sandarakinorhabdus sp.]|uniref:phage portal protein n=1 Tax=Sandarakinorhabdus sp. TaxID=1916663 RepID=UPI0028A93B7C|nr:phage portal protein [Sandarakinorhabdus sp.]